MLEELFPGSTDFTEAIFKIPQISKHFSAMLINTFLQPSYPQDVNIVLLAGVNTQQ